MMSSEYLLVPVELCKYAISNHIENQFFTFILLKKTLSGVGRIDKNMKGQLAKIQGRSERTIDRYIQRLLEDRFMTYDRKTGVYFVSSWVRLIQQNEIKYWTGVKCYPAKIKDPQAFCAGAVIGRLVNEKRLKEKGSKGIVQKRKARTLNISYKPLFQDCSNRALARICKISTSQAFYNQYLIIRKNFEPIIIDGYHIELTEKDKKYFRESYPEFHQVTIKDGKAYSVDSDLIRSRMDFKRSQNFL